MAEAFELQIQQLAAQVAALQANAQAPAPVQNPAGPFALTPAMATQDVIDYTTSTGIKLYKTIITPNETKFDGSSGKLLAFLDDIEQKALRYGWNTNLLSISNQANPPIRFNLLQSHRRLTIENVQAHARTYIGTQTRLAQDASMMYEFLRDSLTEGARARLATESAKYTIEGVRDGPSYLKTLLVKFYVETKATNFHIRQKLQRLPAKIVELKYNVATFNDYVMELVQDLAGGGETLDDLIVYLFDSYLQVTDEAFKRYIERKKEVYDEGTEELTVGTLMDLALVKYNQITQADELKHNGTTEIPEQKQVFALIAELKSAIIGKGFKPNYNKSNGKGPSPRDTKYKGSKTTYTKGKTNSTDGNKKKLPEWRYKREGNQLTMVKDGKSWKWCTFHGYWCEHDESECRAKKKLQGTKGDGQAPKTKRARSQDEGQTSDNSLSIARALFAIAEGDETQSDTDL
jgi:hypothetical protein